MKTYKSQETCNRILEILERREKGAYIRFGDGDINIMYGSNDMLNVCVPNFSIEEREAVCIRDKNYLVALPLNSKSFGLFEEHMFPGNHEWPEETANHFYKKITNLTPIEHIYSAVALHYLCCHHPESAYKFFNDFKKFRNGVKAIFIGNKSIPINIIETYFGNVNRIDCQERNCYSQIDEIERQVLHEIAENDYVVIIGAFGCATRPLAKRLWDKDKNFFFFDVGSVIDALCGQCTRAYIELTGFNSKDFLNKYIKNDYS